MPPFQIVCMPTAVCCVDSDLESELAFKIDSCSAEVHLSSLLPILPLTDPAYFGGGGPFALCSGESQAGFFFSHLESGVPSAIFSIFFESTSISVPTVTLMHAVCSLSDIPSIESPNVSKSKEKSTLPPYIAEITK